jgi:hypothetical protein
VAEALVATLRKRQRGAAGRLAELLALTAFAIAQPLLDVTGRSPDFFLYRQPSVGQLRLLVALVVAGPPLAMWAVELAAGLVDGRAARGAHDVFVAALFTVIGIEVGKQLHVTNTGLLVAMAAVVAASLTVLTVRTTGLRRAIRYATPAPLVFALLFVAASPSGALVRGSLLRAAAAARPAVVAKPAPIVFLFLDEFPERALLDAHGRIDGTLFPNFARLAAASTWYPNATGVSGWTPFAAPAMLSGRYPRQHLAPSYLAYPQNLFTWLAGTYDLRVFETISQLCPPADCPDADAEGGALREMLRDTADVTGQLMSPERSPRDLTQLPDPLFRLGRTTLNQPDRFTRFLDGLAPRERPTLHFLHLLLPHTPWRYLPSGAAYQPVGYDFVPREPGEPPEGVMPRDPTLSVMSRQRLLLQTAYLDRLLGILLDRMRDSGLFDDALLVVTADHGVGLTPATASRTMDGQNPADLCWVPLFVKLPNQRAGRVDDRNEQQVDLVPTIGDAIGAPVPWPVDGRSLLGPPRRSPDKLWFDEPGEARHIEVARWRGRARTGIAAEVARPDPRGTDRLFAAGPLRGLVGKPVSSLTVREPAAPHARLADDLDIGRVDPASGRVPALLWGTFDQPLGPRSTWVVAAVNGTVAGTIPAVRGGDGGWRFVGIVNDRYFRTGANDVRLYTVTGTTLHEVVWA